MSAAVRQFRKTHSGIAMLAKAMLGTSRALETRQDFEQLIADIKANSKTLIATTDFGDNPKDGKAGRKVFREMELEANRFALNLQRRVLSAKQGQQTILFVQMWMDKYRGKTLSWREAEASLLAALSQDFIELPSDGVTRGMLEAIERGKHRRDADDDGNRPDWPRAGGVGRIRDGGTESWTHELMPSKLARALSDDDKNRNGVPEEITLGQFLPTKDFDEKLQAAMDRYGRTLGDRDSDLLMFAMQKYTERARKAGDLVSFTIDELTAALFPKYEGGSGGETYRSENKRYVRERFERLADGFLSIQKALRPSKTSTKTLSLQSQVLMIEERAGQADFDGRVSEWQSVQVRFGVAWAHRLFEPGGPLTAAIQARALRYSPDKEMYEKRLLKRLGFYWRMNRHHSTVGHTVADWLMRDIGDERFNEIDMSFKRPEAERLEEAFNRLKVDAEIAGWWYAGGEPALRETPGQLQHGWRAEWLSRELVVEAPGSVKAFYAERLAATVEVKAKAKALPAPAKAAPAKAPDARLGARCRACRTAQGITGLQAAAAMGISNSALSRIETGKAEPTKAQAAAMTAWMDMAPASSEDGESISVDIFSSKATQATTGGKGNS